MTKHHRRRRRRRPLNTVVVLNDSCRKRRLNLRLVAINSLMLDSKFPNNPAKCSVCSWDYFLYFFFSILIAFNLVLQWMRTVQFLSIFNQISQLHLGFVFVSLPIERSWLERLYFWTRHFKTINLKSLLRWSKLIPTCHSVWVPVRDTMCLCFQKRLVRIQG